MCMFPTKLSIPAAVMQHLTYELIWGQDAVQVDKTYENIASNNFQNEERRTLTRLENVVTHHERWKEFCNGYLKECISAIIGTEMVFFKEKLNLQPQGGVVLLCIISILGLSEWHWERLNHKIS